MWFQQIFIFHTIYHCELSLHWVFFSTCVHLYGLISFTLIILFLVYSWNEMSTNIIHVETITCIFTVNSFLNEFRFDEIMRVEKKLNYPKRGITWFVGRWRTQQTARIYVNCRTHEHRYFERILRFILTRFITETV